MEPPFRGIISVKLYLVGYIKSYHNFDDNLSLYEEEINKERKKEERNCY